MKRGKAVFLDRDGVINRNLPGYVRSWEEFEFLPKVQEAIRVLSEAGFRIFVITNQAGIGRGFTSLEAVEEVHRRMVASLAEAGAKIEAVYLCPHVPELGCDCRKPQPGMLWRARQEYQVDLTSAYLIGDALSDLQAAHAVGCYPILVSSGRGITEAEGAPVNELGPYYAAEDLAEAVRWILQREGLPSHPADDSARTTEKLEAL